VCVCVRERERERERERHGPGALRASPGEEQGVCVICTQLPISRKLEFRSLGGMAGTEIVNKS